MSIAPKASAACLQYGGQGQVMPSVGPKIFLLFGCRNYGFLINIFQNKHESYKMAVFFSMNINVSYISIKIKVIIFFCFIVLAKLLSNIFGHI